MTQNNAQGGVSLSTLRVIRHGRATLLDAVASQTPGRAELFFSHDTPVDAVTPGEGAVIEDKRTVGGAPWLTVSWNPALPLEMVLDGAVTQPKLSQPELAPFAGLNLALAVRNGERAELVADWLKYHRDRHGLDGALIISRARAGGDPGFAVELDAALVAAGIDCVVRIVEADHPLGYKNLPPEAHPYCAPDAPGRDRMTVPPADPWTSPMAEALIYQWARVRFLGHARAVANIDVFDLLIESQGQGVFDRACDSTTGVIALQGRHCFPWRVRDAANPEFADHACVAFDATGARRRWCVAPGKLPKGAVLRPVRVGGVRAEAGEGWDFYRFMALRHSGGAVSRIVPKSSLVVHPPLRKLLAGQFSQSPILPPEERPKGLGNGRRAVVTTMKNEGPFILEWLAYHRAIGIDDFLVYTNDCTDGTDRLLDLLQDRGIVQHRDNPFRQTSMKPQHAALAASEREPVIAEAEWVVCMDVDEFINVKCGDGTLDALFAHLGDANMIAMTWRLFGNSDIHGFAPDFVTRQFTRCAPEFTRKPHQAWGFKTLFRNQGIFRKLGVHRPKGLKPQLWEEIRWVNGSGQPLPSSMYRNAWRSTTDSYGYDLVQLNHYAVRSAESFLVKRDRGRVNHVDRDQGLGYWFRMNNNADRDLSIQRTVPRMQAEFDRLMQDPQIANAHRAAVAAHRNRVVELRLQPEYADFFSELTSARQEKLARMHAHFGANVFLQGPGSIPPEIVARDPEEEFHFTVDRGETEH